MPVELWEFVEKEAGIYGEKSKVIQEALRQMQNKLKKSGNGDLRKATNEIKGGSKKGGE